MTKQKYCKHLTINFEWLKIMYLKIKDHNLAKKIHPNEHKEILN